MTQKLLSVACPVCKQQLEWSDRFPHRPFCSDRCKMIDLGDWASEAHRIAGEPVMDDLMSEDLEKLPPKH